MFFVGSNQRGFQDSWILEGIFIPTILYVLTFTIVVVATSDVRILTIISSSFVIVLNSIPSLKYQLFYGVFDSAGHYGFINRLLASGQVPQTGFYVAFYGDFPGMHILIGSLSLILGVSTNVAIKLFTSLIYGIVPLMVYLVTNRVFDGSIQRAIIIASGLPAIPTSYVLGGGTFGLALYFIFFCVLFRRGLTDNSRFAYSVILLVLGFALLFSHAATMPFLLWILAIVTFYWTIRGIRKETRVDTYGRGLAPILIILAASFTALQAFKAIDFLAVFVGGIERALLRESLRAPIPPRLFALPLSAQLTFLALYYVMDLIVFVLGLVGLLILMRRIRIRNGQLFEKFYLPVILVISALGLIVAFQLASSFGEIGVARALNYSMIFQPFFIGLVLWLLLKSFASRTLKSVLPVVFLFLTISISLIQIFPYQPMVPRANVLSKELPASDYLADLREVNTLCNIAAITFAEYHSTTGTRIASDIVTRWQIYGFTSEAFNNGHIWYSPLETTTPNWDIFILHYDGTAGPLKEKVENRTGQRIMMLKDTLGNVVYDGGGCFIIEHV